MLLTIDKRGSKIARNSVFDCHCQAGEKWQLKTQFLTIFDLRSAIVLMLSIATYLVCIRRLQWISDFIWDFRKHPFSSHVGKYFI